MICTERDPRRTIPAYSRIQTTNGSPQKTSSTSCGFILVKRMFRSSTSGGLTDEDFGLGIPEYIADNTNVPYTSLDDVDQGWAEP